MVTDVATVQKRKKHRRREIIMELCRRADCPGCGACAYICGKNAIQMCPDSIGTIYPVLDKKKCVSCGACQKVCPALNPVERRENLMAYAAWSNSAEERRTSASGGIAAEMYRYYLQQGGYIAGAKVNDDLETVLCVTDDLEQVSKFKNSKYVFSTIYALFPELNRLLNEKKKVMVIGLPCQIASIRNVFHEDNLFLADVVCHGTTNHFFLSQHIKTIEKKTHKSIASISFRDPEKDTTKHYLSFFDVNGNCLYSKRTSEGDLYQFGYHRALSYRENCYHCQYACSQRISDVTLSDYKGLGKLKACDYSQDKVSLVLVHTEKGKKLIDSLIQAKRITADIRPLLEGIQGDPQLNHPSLKTYGRGLFERKIEENHGNFEKTMSFVVRAVSRRQIIEKIINRLKRISKTVLLR